MTWLEIRQQYPHRWLIVEALDASTEHGKRLIHQMQVIQSFENIWKPAWECFKALCSDNPVREYYMLHTDRENLDIRVMDAFRRVTE